MVLRGVDSLPENMKYTSIELTKEEHEALEFYSKRLYPNLSRGAKTGLRCIILDFLNILSDVDTFKLEQEEFEHLKEITKTASPMQAMAVASRRLIDNGTAKTTK